jgi:histone-lysine N-methyltransferase SETD3
MCVCSRNFGIVANNTKTAVLVPYADMLNHYRPRETKWMFEDSSQSFRVTSLQPINLGSQVYDSYGMKCNHRFLLNYGFSCETNIEPDGFCPNEVMFEIEMKVSPDEYSVPISNVPDEQLIHLFSNGSWELFEQKAALLKRENPLMNRRMLRVCVSDNDATRSLLALLRIICADENDFFPLVSGSRGDRPGGSYRSVKNACTPISIRNEIATLRTLRVLCSHMLNQYPTTLAEDMYQLREANLENVPLYSNKRHALIHVRGEKQVLHHYRQLADSGLMLLAIQDSENQVTEITDILHSIRADFHPLIFEFCNHVVLPIREYELEKCRRVNRNLDLSKPTIV